MRYMYLIKNLAVISVSISVDVLLRELTLGCLSSARNFGSAIYRDPIKLFLFILIQPDI